MSWRHAKAVIDLKLRKPPVCALLLALAHHADEYSGQCWPSLERLSDATGFSRRTVQTAIQEAERLNLIRYARGGNRRASVYTLTLPAAPALDRGSGKPASFETIHSAAAAVHSAAVAGHGAAPAPQHSKNNQENSDAPARARSHGSLLPDDWQPSAEMVAQAGKDYPDADIVHETRQFIAVNQRDGTLGHNWDAAWRAWIGRSNSFKRRGGGSGTGAGGGSDAARLRRLADEASGRSH